MPGRVARMEVTDLTGFSDISIVNETKEDFYKDIANTTVKPVIERLKAVYEKYNRRYPWNAFLAIGLRIYSFARKGYDMDYYGFARSIARRWSLPDNVVRDIVDAVLAEVKSGTTTRRR